MAPALGGSYQHNSATISLHEMREPCALEQGLANRLFLLTSRPSVLCSSGKQLFRKQKPIPADLSKENIGKVLS